MEYGQLKELLLLSLKGDEEAYTRFLHEVCSIIKSHIKVQTGYSNEDIVQEVLISIHKARHTFDPEKELGPWLSSIITYRIADSRRGYWRHLKKLEAYTLEKEIDAQVCTDNSKIEDVRIAMEELSEQQRGILFLSKVEGYSFKEISHTLEITVSAAKVTAHRAYRKLKKIIERDA